MFAGAAASDYKPQPMRRLIIGSLGLALLASACVLAALAVTNLRLKCEDGGHPECAFIEQTAREVGRMEALAATSCALIGGGALMFIRSGARVEKKES